ncbi:hypothetical protein D6C82_08011 [Aureobasidium pullulans]|nr:hypothetical protein D6C82_08011 [Aureobasidium pullulans]
MYAASDNNKASPLLLYSFLPLLKVYVARERAYFLRYLNTTEYDPNSYIGNVYLRKDANKVKRSPLAITAFYKEPIVAAAPNDSNDDKDSEDSNSSNSFASDIDEYY